MKRVSSAVAAGSTAVVLAVTLSGCGVGTGQPDPTATARLDRDSGQIILPLDEYLSSESTETTMTRARLAILRSCLEPKGHNGVKPPSRDDRTELEDRRYGLWLPERARTHGFGLPGTPSPAVEMPTPPGGWSDEDDPAFNAAYDECVPEVMDQMEAVSSPMTTMGSSSAVPLMLQASVKAKESPEWATARDDWSRCLTDAGLTPVGEDDGWTSREALALPAPESPKGRTDTAKREEIRIAVIEAECNEQTNLTQRLGDIEAGYQAALIKGNEAALAEEKRITAERLDAARAYLAEHQ
ncbi:MULTISPECIES: hypothetical protein [Micrococcus]|uniref:Secreted protein n=2 Tax=Micrococcus lylae TaxID=1273 RepID=A0ABY2K341_9MICC|nr:MULTISPECIES: hypothetical protein [Micrococcus]PNL18621.1 hypothetical protein CEQ11_011460 [Micrococcus sp. FDAARGOS_333]TFH98986.1 hypothetical protein E4A49_07200 [Micrococcus lylae]